MVEVAIMPKSYRHPSARHCATSNPELIPRSADNAVADCVR
jgi:hypothetical protein